MATIEVDLTSLKEITNQIYYPLFKNDDRYLVLFGGAGSGKSWYVCEKNIIRTLEEENSRILVIRKVARTLRRSVFQLFQDYFLRWGVSKLFDSLTSTMDIKCTNGNMIYFAGIDDPEKMKSIEGITSVWIEEASELLLKDFEEVDRRLRGKTKGYKQIILTYNPISIFNWTNERFFTGQIKHDGRYWHKENTTILQTTYKDNKFIDQEYIDVLESYTGNARMVYTLGEYGKLENSVYSNWDIIDVFPDTDKELYGLDFGYENPQALVKVYLREKNLFVQEMMYERKQTNPILLEELEKMGLRNKLIIADNEMPSTIQEIKNNKFNIIPCKKGEGSVEAGIKYIQGLRIHITKDSPNLTKEIQSYQRKKDREGNAIEAVEKSNDHLLDAMRYVVFTHYYEAREKLIIRVR
jgi:phage terminase large subunit